MGGRRFGADVRQHLNFSGIVPVRLFTIFQPIMSIAVSAVVRTSICLRLLQAGFAVSAIAAGLILGSARVEQFLLPLPGACASMLTGVFFLLSLFKNRNPRRIDISGVGQIRVTVYQDICTGAGSVVVNLMTGSTLWPSLLLLRLRAHDGRIVVLPVWPDSVARAAFRPLAVACRAIATRNTELE